MRLLVLLLASWVASGVFATEVKSNPNERDYIIEVLIFAQQPGAGATELSGRPHIYLPLEQTALKIGTAPAWTRLSRVTSRSYWPQKTKLNREATALNRSEDYRLLFHEAWRMGLVAEPKSLPLLIEGGDYYAGMPELQGKLKLSVARYLHLETDLFFNTFESTANHLSNNKKPLIKTASQFAAGSQALEASALPKGSNLIEGIFQVKSSAGMHQHRRMRSNELHFIDSPYLGLLIKIDRAP